MVTRVRAPNPSALTLDGTNGYIITVGPGALVAIDPGIDDEKHINAFVDFARDAHAHYAAIIVTHGHPDHFPGALALRRATRAPIIAHPNATYGHDRSVADNARLTFEDSTLTVLHVPGHAPDHIAIWLEPERALFTGDVVIGMGTVVIAPPAGDMRLYQASLERLLRDYGNAHAIYGGHGPTVRSPRAKLTEYIEHRQRRETEILAELGRSAATIPELVAAIYAEVDSLLWPAAGRQILAYLIALEREGIVTGTPLERELTAEEARVMSPDLSALANRDDNAVLVAELGLENPASALLVYELRN